MVYASEALCEQVGYLHSNRGLGLAQLSIAETELKSKERAFFLKTF